MRLEKMIAEIETPPEPKQVWKADGDYALVGWYVRVERAFIDLSEASTLDEEVIQLKPALLSKLWSWMEDADAFIPEWFVPRSTLLLHQAIDSAIQQAQNELQKLAKESIEGLSGLQQARRRDKRFALLHERSVLHNLRPLALMRVRKG